MNRQQAPAGQVLIVGSLNADYTVRTARLPQPGETVNGTQSGWHAGGKGANQAVAARRQGSSVTMVGAVGADPHATMLIRRLQALGIGTAGIRRIPDQPTGTALITIDDNGENTVITCPGANSFLAAEDVEQAGALTPDTDVVCLCLEIPEAVVRAVACRSRDLGATTILNLSPFRAVDPHLLRLTDILVVNEIEARQMTGWQAGLSSPADRADVALRLRRMGLPRVVITLGRDGALIIDNAAGAVCAPHHEPGISVLARDTTGCGDAFAGALASRLAARCTLAEAARHAVVTAGLAATRPGSQSCPTYDEVIEHL